MILDDQLARLWAAGATLAQIEQAIGVSRGVAIGRIHRARKAGDEKFAPRPPKPKARKLKPIGERVGNVAVFRSPLRQNCGCWSIWGQGIASGQSPNGTAVTCSAASSRLRGVRIARAIAAPSITSRSSRTASRGWTDEAMTDNTLRQRLAIPMPPRIARLPRTKHGLPVPYIADEHDDGSPDLGVVEPGISGDCHRLRLCSICGEKLAPAERTFITGPSGVFGPNCGCGDPPMHGECARYALRVCPHLVAPGSVSVVITAPRYRLGYIRTLGTNANYWPYRPYKRVEWWSEGKQVIDRDEILGLLAGETRNAVAQFLTTSAAHETRRAAGPSRRARTDPTPRAARRRAAADRRSAVTEIRIIGDAIELDGATIATLVPNLRLSTRDRLEELFDRIDEDEAEIAELEERIAQIKKTAP